MIPLYILAIEDESDREFMTGLYIQYHRLMYHEIYKLLHDPWATDDVLQAALEKLIDRIGQLREMDRTHLVNYLRKTNNLLKKVLQTHSDNCTYYQKDE